MKTSTASALAKSGISYKQLVTSGISIGFAAVTGLLLATHMGALAHFFYPTAALLLAIVLYATDRKQYVSFNIWLWMLTPFVRRVVDYQTSYHSQSIVMLAPLLASGVCVYKLAQDLPKLYQLRYLPFFFVLVALIYGYLVGVINATPLSASFDLLLWLVPMAFGFMIARDWRSFPMYRDAVIQTFIASTAVMGVYGVYQYFMLPPWDAKWIIDSGLMTQGLPFPQEVRVFSTLNSVQPYGAVTMAGLACVVTATGFMRFPAVGFGIVGLALSAVRTAWIGLVLAVGYLILTLGSARRLRLLGGIALGALVAMPIITSGPIGKTFVERFETFGDVKSDISYRERTYLYKKFVPTALSEIVGVGVGAVGVATKLQNRNDEVVVIDSGILIIPYTMGWFGALMMLVGLGMLVLRPPGRIDRRNADDVHTCNAIVYVMLAMMTSYNCIYGVGGIIFWGFAGLGIGARLWAEHTPYGGILAQR